MKVNKSIGVIGGGSWATALAKILSEKNPKVHWWLRNPESVAHIKKYHHNPNYLRAVEFNTSRLAISSDLEEVVRNCEILIIAIPSAFVHSTFQNLDPALMQGKIIGSAIKGIIPEFHSIPAKYFHSQFNIPYDDIGIICGPCHAEEVAMERLSYLTIACLNEANARIIANKLSTRFIKLTISEDLFGAEIAAVLKNIYAIASGVCRGLGYGDNFQALLMSAAIRELERFIDVTNPFHRDVKEAAYLGDLLVTSYSQFSRNRTFGYMIGKGYSVKAAQLEMEMIAEGYYAVKSIYEMNKEYNVDIPIAEAVYNILYERISPVVEIRILADQLS